MTLTEHAREARLRRLLHRNCYSLRRNRSRCEERPDYRGYAVLDAYRNAWVTGEVGGMLFWMSLDDVAEWAAELE